MSYFRDILTVINFNRPHYSVIPFIREIYKDFPHVVFYGDGDLQGPEHPGVIRCPQNGGFFAYRAMSDAMNRFPGYRGYLFVMDDVLLNIKNLLGKDKDRVWFPGLDPSCFMDVLNPHPADWWAWESTFGLDKCRAAWEKFPEDCKERLQTTLKISNGFVGQHSDVYYIPGRLAGKWNVLAGILSVENVFHEIAIPTALCAIEDPGYWDVLNIKYLWGVGPDLCSFTGDRVRWRSFLRKDLEGLHPVKFSDPQNQDTARWFLAHADKKGFRTFYGGCRDIKESLLRISCDLIGMRHYFFRWIKTGIKKILRRGRSRR